MLAQRCVDVRGFGQPGSFHLEAREVAPSVEGGPKPRPSLQSSLLGHELAPTTFCGLMLDCFLKDATPARCILPLGDVVSPLELSVVEDLDRSGQL
eukprot:8958648-Pyramimonas_sp.AAC.1